MSEKNTNERIIYNCHLHLFNIDHIPLHFINRFASTKMAKSIAANQKLSRALLKLFPRALSRYTAFLYSALNNDEEIFEELAAYYPGKTKFVPLSVDFDYMKAGMPIKPFLEQLEDLRALKLAFPDQILPFIGTDPRRPQVLDLVKKYIIDYGFAGIKMYPSLGFFPNDERLYPVYEWAQENEIPITSHCIPKNPNHYRGKITDEQRQQAAQVPGYNAKEAKKKYDFAMYFNHPHWWEQVLKDFPNLKINLAHFGGNVEWDRYLDDPFSKKRDNKSWYYIIRKMIENEAYPNVYADISFTVFDRALFPVLKSLLTQPKTENHVLFGSDFYMLQKDYRERRFGFDVRGYLSDDHYWKLACDNPRRFLANKVHGAV